MEHLLKLQIFKYQSTLQVAAQMFKDGRNSLRPLPETGIRQLVLMDLRCGGDIPYEKGDLEAAIALCPSVVHVQIRAWKVMTFTDEELKHLLNLKNLRHLSLSSSDVFSFEGGILPILQKFGQSTLENLKLKFLLDVDVSAIAKYCSKLRSLTLMNIERIISPPQPLKPQDNRLRILEYLKMEQHDEEGDRIVERYSASDILILLSSPALVNVSFRNFDGDRMNGLSDRTIEKATLLYGFPNLQEFQMEYCVGITQRSIDCLLTLDNPLNYVHFYIEDLNEEDHMKKWESQIKKNNWDLIVSQE